MSQYAKDQVDIALWRELSEDLTRMSAGRSEGMEISEVTQSIAHARGYSPEKVMAGLLEGVERGDLEIADGKVRLHER